MLYVGIDLETLHDKKGIEEINCRVMREEKGKEIYTYEDWVEYMKEKKDTKFVFPDLSFHKVVCVGVMAYDDNSKIVYNKYFYGNNEDDIIKEFWKFFKSIYNSFSYPKIITYNGKKFDLPLLVIKGMGLDNIDECKEGLMVYLDNSDKWENNKPNYTNPYSKYNIDLINEFGVRMSLEKICWMMGVDVKTEGKWWMVEEHINNNEWDKVIKYCLEDAGVTLLLGLILDIIRGNLYINENIKSFSNYILLNINTHLNSIKLS